MNILRHIRNITDAWLNECKAITKDEGVLLFFFFLPIAYPCIYSWIYNNEVVRDVPVVLVDNSNSSYSREFTSMYDAMPDVSIALRCNSIEEAKQAIGKGDAYGILYFPSEFGTKIGRMEQAHVGLYCDMSYMLTYKAIMISANMVSLEMGKRLRSKVAQNITIREEQISASPMVCNKVPIYNATGGYGNFILPAVLVLIIQQATILGVGMIAGTEAERKYANYKSKSSTLVRALTMLFGKSLCYFMIAAVMLAWITLIIPHLFGFVSLVHGKDLLLFFTPYLLSCILFSIVISELVHYRESVMLVVVFSSVPLLFLSGISWPLTSIPGEWQSLASIFPSTYAIRGFIRMSSMGALLPDVVEEYRSLWIQACICAPIALFVMWRRVKYTEEI